MCKSYASAVVLDCYNWNSIGKMCYEVIYMCSWSQLSVIWSPYRFLQASNNGITGPSVLCAWDDPLTWKCSIALTSKEWCRIMFDRWVCHLPFCVIFTLLFSTDTHLSCLTSLVTSELSVNVSNFQCYPVYDVVPLSQANQYKFNAEVCIHC